MKNYRVRKGDLTGAGLMAGLDQEETSQPIVLLQTSDSPHIAQPAQNSTGNNFHCRLGRLTTGQEKKWNLSGFVMLQLTNFSFSTKNCLGELQFG
jgi:hypothetical protein